MARWSSKLIKCADLCNFLYINLNISWILESQDTEGCPLTMKYIFLGSFLKNLIKGIEFLPQTQIFWSQYLAAGWWKALIFQTQIILSISINSLKYHRSTKLGYKDIEIRKSEFVAKTQFLLCSKLNRSSCHKVLFSNPYIYIYICYPICRRLLYFKLVSRPTWSRSVDESTLDLLVSMMSWFWFRDVRSVKFASILCLKNRFYFVFAYSRDTVQPILTIAVIKHVFVLFPWLQLQQKCVENECVIYFQKKNFFDLRFILQKILSRKFLYVLS